MSVNVIVSVNDFRLWMINGELLTVKIAVKRNIAGSMGSLKGKGCFSVRLPVAS